MTRSTRAALAPLLMALLTAVPVGAQNGGPIWGRMDFNFAPSGARALGMAGAFVPVSDDVTAVETNPAGLVHLLHPQFSVEGRILYYQPEPPEDFGVLWSRSTHIVGSPAFASFAMPLLGGVVGAYRHELMAFNNEWSGEYSDAFCDLALSERVGYGGRLEASMINWGVGGAWKLGDRVAVGAAGGVSGVRIMQSEELYGTWRPEIEGEGCDLDPDYNNWRSWSKNWGYGAIWDPETGELLGSETTSATAPFANLGVLLTVGDRWTLGAVFKRRPKFEDLETPHAAFGVPRLADGSPGAPSDTSMMLLYDFQPPDALGVGAAFRPSENLLFSLDMEWIRHSQLAQAANRAGQAQLTADDAVDLHFGTEYVVFAGQRPIALRSGVAWGRASTLYDDDPAEPADLRLFYGYWGDSESDVRLSMGMGTLFRRNIQLDVAGLVGTTRQVLTTSVVYLLGRN